MANNLRSNGSSTKGGAPSQAPAGGDEMASSTYLDNKYPAAKGVVDVMYEERTLNAEKGSNMIKGLSQTGNKRPSPEGGSAANTSSNGTKRLGMPRMGQK